MPASTAAWVDADRRHPPGWAGRPLAVILAAAIALAGIGCGLEPGSGQCVETKLEPLTTEVGSDDLPLTLSARLTADRKPVPGAAVGFYVHADPPLGAEPNIYGVGQATTDSDGVADHVTESGLAGLLHFPDRERLVGYQVDFSPVAKVGGVQYCRTRAETTLVVR